MKGAGPGAGTVGKGLLPLPAVKTKDGAKAVKKEIIKSGDKGKGGKPIRPPRIKTAVDPKDTSSTSSTPVPPVPPVPVVAGQSPPVPTVPDPAADASQTEVSIIQELILSAASAAAMASSEAVIASLTRAYGLPQNLRTNEVIHSNGVPIDVKKENESSKMCMMSEKWGCSNNAIKGPKGWLKTNKNWWKLCTTCMDQMKTQQNHTDGQDVTNDSSDDG